jgi:uncharacterized protein (TIGR02118 family)
MVKTLVLMSRRTDLTRAAFRDYYERNHTVLGMRYFRFRKYIRNHVVAPDEGPFDVLSEFWQDSLPEVYAAMAGPVGDIMREDGNRFIDRSQQRLASCEERLLAGTPRGVDPTPTRKQLLFLTAGSGAMRQDFFQTVARWGAELAEAARGRIVRVTMDSIAPFEGAPFPYDAILSLWLSGEPKNIGNLLTPAEVSLDATATVDACETAPDVLAATFEG